MMHAIHFVLGFFIKNESHIQFMENYDEINLISKSNMNWLLRKME